MRIRDISSHETLIIDFLTILTETPFFLQKIHPGSLLKAFAAIWRKIRHGWKIWVFHGNTSTFVPNACFLLRNGLMNSKSVFCTFTSM